MSDQLPIMYFSKPPQAGECYQSDTVNLNSTNDATATVYVVRVGVDNADRRVIWVRNADGHEWAAEWVLAVS